MRRILSALLLTATIAAAQAPSFEVISIKGTDPNAKIPVGLNSNPGGITFTNASALDCIMKAYGVKDYQVVGPDWLKSARFDIAARTASAANDVQLNQMLQSLLESRFKLTMHRENKELSVYAITESKNGTRLRPAQAGPENSLRFQGNALAFRNYSIAALGRFLSTLPGMDRAITDASELKGSYDFDIVVDAEGNDPGAVKRAMLDWATLFSDMDRQLGLKVEARKAPAEMLVIDRIEKPIPN